MNLGALFLLPPQDACRRKCPLPAAGLLSTPQNVVGTDDDALFRRARSRSIRTSRPRPKGFA